MMKLMYFILAAIGLAFCLFMGNYAGAAMIIMSGFMVASA